MQVLGIVSDDVAKTAEGFSLGNTSVVESRHTVVLNVNSTTEDMLRQASFLGCCDFDCVAATGQAQADLAAHQFSRKQKAHDILRYL